MKATIEEIVHKEEKELEGEDEEREDVTEGERKKEKIQKKNDADDEGRKETVAQYFRKANEAAREERKKEEKKRGTKVDKEKDWVEDNEMNDDQENLLENAFPQISASKDPKTHKETLNS